MICSILYFFLFYTLVSIATSAGSDGPLSIPGEERDNGTWCHHCHITNAQCVDLIWHAWFDVIF